MRSRLKWAGPVDRMEVERLLKRADALRLEGRRRRGRQRLGWEEEKVPVTLATTVSIKHDVIDMIASS